MAKKKARRCPYPSCFRILSALYSGFCPVVSLISCVCRRDPGSCRLEYLCKGRLYQLQTEFFANNKNFRRKKGSLPPAIKCHGFGGKLAQAIRLPPPCPTPTQSSVPCEICPGEWIGANAGVWRCTRVSGSKKAYDNSWAASFSLSGAICSAPKNKLCCFPIG